MKKLIIAVAVVGAFAGSMAHAEDATPEHSFTGNVSLVSDYRFRGISQTFKQPAIQGGFDYAHSSGFYVGNWNSSVSGTAFTDGSIEMDLYAGYKFDITPDFKGDVGVLQYYYPGARITDGKKYNTTEVYGALSYKWFTAKYSHSVSDFFGQPDSKGSGYLELNAVYEVAEKTNLSFHVGHQKVRHFSEADYTDYKVGIDHDFGFATVGLAVVTTNAKDFYIGTNSTGKEKKLANTGAVLSISKAF